MNPLSETFYTLRYSLLLLALIVALYLLAYTLLAALAASFAVLLCGVWLIASLVKNAIWRPGWRIFSLRLLMPIVTCCALIALARLQITVIQGNMETIGAACMAYHTDTGSFPEELDALVPKYLDSVPTLFFGFNFRYRKTGDSAFLEYAIQPPFGRLFYNLPEKNWSSLDVF